MTTNNEQEQENLDFAIIEHLGPMALTGTKMSPVESFEIAWREGRKALRAENETELAEALARIAELERSLLKSEDINAKMTREKYPFVHIRMDASEAQKEGALRDKMIELGWMPPESIDRIKLATLGSIKPHWDDKNQMFVAHYEDIAKMADEIKTRLRQE